MAASSSSIMATALATQAATTLASSYAQSQAIEAQGEFQAQQFETNARLSDLSAAERIALSSKQAGALKARSDQLRGQQEVSFAHGGVDVNSAQAKSVITESAVIGELDRLAVVNNAWREAWGFKVQADDFRARGNFAKIGSEFASEATLLTGGLRAAAQAGQAVAVSRGFGNEFQLGDSRKVTDGDAANRRDTKGDRMVASERRRIINERTKKNPLFPDTELNTSWWRRTYFA